MRADSVPAESIHATQPTSENRGLDDFCMLSPAMVFFRAHRSGSGRRPTLLGQAVAWLAIGVVGLLAWLAVDPAAHAWLHAEGAHGASCADGHTGCTHQHAPAKDHSADDHHCVVTDFAAGATDILQVALLVVFALRTVAQFLPLDGDTPRAASFLRHAPSCAPPGCA